MESKTEILQNYNAIDLLKFCMATMVVAIHTQLCVGLSNPWFRIAVPIFFILSSYFFFKKIKEKAMDEQKSMLKNYVKRVLFLYMFWLLILSPLIIIIKWNSFTSHGFFIMLVDIFRRVITGRFFGASWFLVALIIGVPIIFYLSQYLSNKKLFVITLVINMLVVMQCGYGKYCSEFVSIFRSLMSRIVGTNLEFTFLTSLFWLFVGKYLSDLKYGFNRSYLFLGIVVSSIILFMENFFMDYYDLAYRHDLYFTLIPLCILITLYIGEMKCRIFNAKVLRQLSTIIYCVHFTLIDSILYISNLFKWEISNIILFIFTYLLSLAVGLLIISYTNMHPNSILKYSY